MGTNFYLRTNVCPNCGRYDEQHIGKSSYGWSFTFQGTSEIRSYKHWLGLLVGEGKIFDEYGRIWTLGDFKAKVEAKQGGRNHAREYPQYSWVDEEGHSFSEAAFS